MCGRFSASRVTASACRVAASTSPCARSQAAWASARAAPTARAASASAPASRTVRAASASARTPSAAAFSSASRRALVPRCSTSCSSRRASSIRLASSFSAMVRSRSTATARRSYVARSASCWICSRAGVRRARSTSASGRMATTRTATTSMPVAGSLGSAARPAATRSRTAATPSTRAAASGVRASTSRVCCWAVSVRRVAICSRGAPRQAPVSGSTEKSRRAAASAGSLIRYVTVACTVTSWKSEVRAWNAMASSRSLTGTSESAALSDRYQKLSPVPSWTSVPRLWWRMCAVGAERRWRQPKRRVMSAMGTPSNLSRHEDDKGNG